MQSLGTGHGAHRSPCRARRRVEEFLPARAHLQVSKVPCQAISSCSSRTCQKCNLETFFFFSSFSSPLSVHVIRISHVNMTHPSCCHNPLTQGILRRKTRSTTQPVLDCAAWRDRKCCVHKRRCHSLPSSALVDDAVDIIPAAVPARKLLNHVAANLAGPAGRTRPRRSPFGDFVGLVVGLCRRARPLLRLRVGRRGLLRVCRGLSHIRRVVCRSISRRRYRLGAGVELGFAVRHCVDLGRRVGTLRVHRFAEGVAYAGC